MPANNTGGMAAKMKAYNAAVAKKKGQYASSDRMTAMAKAAGKPVAGKQARSMPVSPLKKAARPMGKTPAPMGRTPTTPKSYKVGRKTMGY